jgi:hypothetical protein
MVQATSGSNALARLKKISGSEALTRTIVRWLNDGLAFEIHGWRKLKGRWAPRVIIAQRSPQGIEWEETS